MIDFRRAQFVLSSPNRSSKPSDVKKEIVFIGRSNVGKSSLLNAICNNRSLAFTSSKPGHTRLLNYYSLGDGHYLVDAPGYGYSAAGKGHTIAFGEMMEDYFEDNHTLKGIVYLLDSRRKVNEEDQDFLHYLLEQHIPIAIVITKCDKLNQKEKAQALKNLSTAFPNYLFENLLYVSIKQKESLVKIQKVLLDFFK